MLIFAALTIFGVVYTLSCRTNQREIVMLEIKKIERNILSSSPEDKKFWNSELKYQEFIYSKINGWNSLKEIYAAYPNENNGQ